MSVQVKRRREAASYLAGFVGAQAELLVDTTNNRVQVHDGVTPGGFPAAKLAEVVTNARAAVADAGYTVQSGDRTVAMTTLSAPRTIALPAASGYPTGTRLLVVDESGACATAAKITVAAAGSDRINGAAAVFIAIPYGFVALESNGLGKWTIVDQSPGSIGALLGAPTASFLFTPGGDGTISFYRMDAARAQIPRTSSVAGVSAATLTLSGSSDATLFFTTIMAGVAYARIWNVTKSPAQPAWIKAAPAANQLSVTAAADIATWSIGDTVQIGDPSALHGGINVLALDISPMQIALFGQAFPQTGIIAKANIVGVNATLAISATATAGSFTALSCGNDGSGVSGINISPCGVLSPISNSNLVFVRETIAAPNMLGTALYSSLAILA